MKKGILTATVLVIAFSLTSPAQSFELPVSWQDGIMGAVAQTGIYSAIPLIKKENRLAWGAGIGCTISAAKEIGGLFFDRVVRFMEIPGKCVGGAYTGAGAAAFNSRETWKNMLLAGGVGLSWGLFDEKWEEWQIPEEEKGEPRRWRRKKEEG